VTWAQALLLAALQGITELFPVSSLGHTVILPALLGWGDVQRLPTFLPFVVLLHLATAAALLLFYRAEWAGIVRAFLASAVRGRLAHTPEEHLAWMLFFGTLPAGLLGFLFEAPLKVLFATPLVASALLVVNGGIMLLTERLLRRRPAAPAGTPATTGALAAARDGGAGPLPGPPGPLPPGGAPPAGRGPGSRTIQDLAWRGAVLIGAAQALALLPGISRSAVTMCAGLLLGMSHEAAARYAFLLATPVILAAGLLEVPVLFEAGPEQLAIAAAGAVVAGVTAYLSVRFLTRYFRFGSLDPFAYYCLIVGLGSLVYLAAHGA